MKTLKLILLLTILPLLSYAQVSSIQTYKIANKNTQFGANLPIGTYIFDISTMRPYQLKKAALSSNTLSTPYLATEIYSDTGAVVLDTNLTLGISGNATLEVGRIETNITGHSVFIGENAGLNDLLENNTKNTFIGYNTGVENTSGHYNTAIGGQTFYSNTTGIANTAIGNSSLTDNTDGNANTAIGMSALSQNTHGEKNVGVGNSAIYSNSNNDGNTAIGYDALHATIYGHNTAIGCEAGSGAAGAGGVFIGYQAGKTEMDSNTLYIENSSSTTPLIYGEFDNDLVKINGNLKATTYGTASVTDTELGYVDGATSNLQGQFNALTTPSLAAVTAIGSTTTGDLTVNGKIKVTGTGNSVLLGTDAGKNDDYSNNWNVFLGYKNSESNTSGAYNVSIGAYTYNANPTGSYNTVVGTEALYGGTGSYNAAFGGYALLGNTTGTYNVGLGDHALNRNTTGSYNTAVGVDAGSKIISGSNNTISSYSVFVGDNIRANASSETNQIILGSGAFGNGSNTATIGNDQITDIYMGEAAGATVHADSVHANWFGGSDFTLGEAGDVITINGVITAGNLTVNGDTITAATGLEQVNSGFRFIEADAKNYGSIGMGATDLMLSGETSTTGGATGDGSVTMNGYVMANSYEVTTSETGYDLEYITIQSPNPPTTDNQLYLHFDESSIRYTGWVVGLNPYTADIYDVTDNGGGSYTLETYAEVIDEGGLWWIDVDTVMITPPAELEFSRINTASGRNSLAIGEGCLASGITSIATGFLTQATADLASAFGAETIASGYYSFATGDETTASGNRSFSIGQRTIASGSASFSGGYGNYSYHNTASGNTAFNFQSGNTASIHDAAAEYSVILGGYNNNIDPSASNSVILGGDGITATVANTTYTQSIIAAGTVDVAANFSNGVEETWGINSSINFLNLLAQSEVTIGNLDESTITISDDNITLYTHEVTIGGETTIEDELMATQYKLSSLNTAPTSATATGTLGEIRVTTTAIYVCTATNTWVKADLATW